MRKIIILLIIMVFLYGCGQEELVRFYGPAVKGDIEIISGKAGLIRSFYFDVIIEHVQKEDWAHLCSFPAFKGAGSVYPLEPVFHITIENTWNRPFVVTGVELVCDNEGMKPEYFNSIGDENFKEKRYRINLNELWKRRRILTKDELIQNIDFKEGTIDYSLGFIGPDDRVSNFYLFNSVPSGCNSLKLAVSIKYRDMEKVIDFELTRVVYSR